MNKRPRPSPARLTDTLVRDADEQRRRLARTIHDGPAQSVAAAVMNLELLERDAAGLGPAARDALNTARNLLQECAGELSRLSIEQEPPFLGDGGLLNALITLARRTGSSGSSRQRLDLKLDAASPLPALGRPIEVAAYRLVEESVGSLFAEDRPVVVQLERTATHLSLTLSGALATGKQASVRLLALRHRAQLAGGRLVIAPAARGGTRQFRFTARFAIAGTGTVRSAGKRGKKSGGP